MKNLNFLKISLLFVAILLNLMFLQAQPLFSVSYNSVPKENVAQLKNQIVNTEISALSLTRNNDQKDVFSVQLSSAENTQLIILNEQTGDNVVITPLKESLTEFQLATFFIEELKQSVLGTADRYLVLEAAPNFSVKNVASVATSTVNTHLPTYLYGKKENVKEALPQDRQIIKICKQKPRLISEFPDDPVHQQYIAQLEEAMNYYVYMYKLPDGTLTIYDEHFYREHKKSVSSVGNFLEFNLSGELNETQHMATEFALELWSYQLGGTVPVNINVDFYPLGQGIIGQSWSQMPVYNYENDTWYPSALWNQIVGYNASGSGDDIVLMMNSQFSFYFGLDGNASKIDYVTIMLHEACHGLGFSSGCAQDGFFYYGSPVIYDRMLYQGLTGPCWTELSDNGRAALITSGNLYAGGPQLLEANEGVRVKIYAPSYYSGGSSVHHWANDVGFETFMKYAYDKPLHTFNTRKIGMMMDMGWKAPEIDPNAVYVNFYANGGDGYRPSQPFLPNVAHQLAINPFAKTGNIFSGWNTEPDGNGVSYDDREIITISNDLNLYAQWQGCEYTLKFYSNGGTVTPSSKQVIYGEPIGELPIPEKEGYLFQGWRINNLFIHEETIWNYAINLTAMAIWTLGVSENQQASFQIIPNPANQVIELKVESGEWRVKNIEIFDIYGKKQKAKCRIQTTSHSSPLISINISDFPAGIYFIKVTTNTGTQTQKFIKL